MAMSRDRSAGTARSDQEDLESASLRLRLRALRREKGLSIGRLARMSGVPASTISKIENGLLNPSLVHAINLASALEANLGFLTDQTRSGHAPFSVVRGAQRARLDYPEMALVLEDLNPGFVPGLLEARIGTIGSGAHSGDEPMHHPGEELAHVLSGRLRYNIDGEEIMLETGDTLHFKSDEPHRWENADEGTTVVLWVFSDGLSF